MRHPRTPQHFPLMKVRGRSRRTTTRPPDSKLAFAATAALAATGMGAERASRALVQIAQSYQASVKALQRDPYLEALGREEPPASSTCPTWFVWSPFGGFADTQCDTATGYLFDTDDMNHGADVPCPMHKPVDFYEWAWGGAYIVPTCARCEQMVPTGTPLQMHELERSLSASAECGSCGKRTWILMRDYADELGDETPEWEAGDLATAAAE